MTDPAIEAMCRAIIANHWPPGGPMSTYIQERTRKQMTAARAAIPIGSTWTTADGTRVKLMPLVATATMRRAGQEEIDQNANPGVVYHAMLAAVQQEPQP